MRIRVVMLGVMSAAVLSCGRDGPVNPGSRAITVRARSATDTALIAIPGFRVRIIQGATTVAEAAVDTSHVFGNLPPGSYQVEGRMGDGAPVSIEADVIDNAGTRVLYFNDPVSGLVAFKPAAPYREPRLSADINWDGVVNAADLALMNDCIQRRSDDCDVDLNGDGSKTREDYEIVHRSWEHYSIPAPARYRAVVSGGGTRVRAGGAEIRSDTGYTDVMLSAVEDPAAVQFSVSADRGTASGAGLKGVRFAENAASPTAGTINLETGEMQNARFTIRLTGGGLRATTDVEGTFTLGQIIFAPHGFRSYHALVRGTLPGSFPGLGGMVFAMAKCDPKQPDVNCAMTAVEVGDAACQAGGFICSSPGAACTVAGIAGVCTSDTVGPSDRRRCRCVCR